MTNELLNLRPADNLTAPAFVQAYWGTAREQRHQFGIIMLGVIRAWPGPAAASATTHRGDKQAYS
ncbi:MAG: hypothetical protein KDD66_06255 [Bdellovibrionales bacterium]|nr:hypothetical protein [Bdellovibrionales bacterium]